MAQIAKILLYLYLGNADAAYNKDLLKKNGITDILNCCIDSIDNAFDDDEDHLFNYTSYKKEGGLSLADTHNCNISQNLMVYIHLYHL